MIAWLAACVAPGEVRHPGEVVVRVPVDGPEDVARLEAAGDLWSEQVRDTVDVRLPRSALGSLDRYEVLIPDVQAAIDTSRPLVERPPGFFDDWQPIDAIDAELDALADRSPDAEVVELGVSLEGRPIRGLQIATPGDDDRLGILVTGAQHAREWVGASSAMWIATHLVDGAGVDPEVTALLDRYRIVVVPVANPDGYRHTWTTDRLWRKNRRDNGDGSWGVDLNRNWDAAWGGAGSSGVGSSDNYHGAAPFSEPETEALGAWLVAHPMVGLYLDLHCTGQLAVHPFAFGPVPPPDQDLLAGGAFEAAAAMQAVSGTLYDDGQFSTRMYVASGVGIDWGYGVRGMGAWLFELRDRGQYGFLLPADQLVPTALEAWAGLVALSEVPERPRLVLALSGSFVPGAPVSVEVFRAQAGDAIEVYSTTRGLGSTVLPDGTELALEEATLLGSGPASTRGRLVLGFVVPNGASGKTVSFQARVRDQPSIVETVDVP